MCGSAQLARRSPTPRHLASGVGVSPRSWPRRSSSKSSSTRSRSRGDGRERSDCLRLTLEWSSASSTGEALCGDGTKRTMPLLQRCICSSNPRTEREENRLGRFVSIFICCTGTRLTGGGSRRQPPRRPAGTVRVRGQCDSAAGGRQLDAAALAACDPRARERCSMPTARSRRRSPSGAAAAAAAGAW